MWVKKLQFPVWNNDCFKIEKAVQQACLLSSCLFNLYTEHIMKTAGLNELQAGIKVSGRNINILSYVDDTTQMAESEGEIKGLLTRVKEVREIADLKPHIKKTKTIASSPITSRQIEGLKVEVVTDFLFFGSKIATDGEHSHEVRR